MIRKRIKGYLIASLFLFSLVGLAIHIGLHSPQKFSYGFVPFIAGVISTLITPVLFCFRRTLHLANIFNGFTAIVGIITMTQFISPEAPMYPDIVLTIVKFLIGVSIFYISLYPDLNAAPSIKGWNRLRYPNMGFWYVHLIMLAVVYSLGHILWR